MHLTFIGPDKWVHTEAAGGRYIIWREVQSPWRAGRSSCQAGDIDVLGLNLRSEKPGPNQNRNRQREVFEILLKIRSTFLNFAGI
jgi:hypothetical protein